MSQLPQMSVGLIDHLIRSGEGEPRLAIGKIPHGHRTPARALPGARCHAGGVTSGEGLAQSLAESAWMVGVGVRNDIVEHLLPQGGRDVE